MEKREIYNERGMRMHSIQGTFTYQVWRDMKRYRLYALFVVSALGIILSTWIAAAQTTDPASNIAYHPETGQVTFVSADAASAAPLPLPGGAIAALAGWRGTASRALSPKRCIQATTRRSGPRPRRPANHASLAPAAWRAGGPAGQPLAGHAVNPSMGAYRRRPCRR